MKRIYEPTCKCPCQMKIDMILSKNAYDFLLCQYWEIESAMGLKNIAPYNVRCAYCLVSLALQTALRCKYDKAKIDGLANAKKILRRKYYRLRILSWFGIE